ncbi:hypothetical protein BD560DRAFT_386826 [Blakeslea trispora]|nr:hypothetical protein BD560DRAFT_386826 [Blakeslea trispora]
MTQFDKQQTASRAPSPVPSAMLSTDLHPTSQSSPHLPLPHSSQRRSSFSTGLVTEPCVEKPLISQRSFPHLKYRRESDSTAVDSDHSITTHESATRFANDKRNHDFHTLFRSVPDHERLLDDYGCALQKEILLQGRVYISEHHLCFNANIFGWITNLVIAFADIEDIEKKSTAFFIPNAILISTQTSKHFLASFLSRDQAYDQMIDIWKNSRANKPDIHQTHLKNDQDDASTFSEDDFSSSSDDSYSDEEIHQNSIQNATDDRQASIVSLPLPKHISPLDDITRQRAASEASQPLTINKPSSEETIQSVTKTECDCGKNDQHFPSVVMDNVYNTSIETIYKLLYDSSFMHQFLTETEKSTDVCIGSWSEGTDNGVKSRESSYVKYLGGSIGPKTTKCYLKEEIHHFDPTNYISQLTITRTPDVPSGGSFTVKTRTCISWCGQGQVRVLVTVLVDFTKSSWLKSTIEKATMDGQQNFYKSLDAAIRKHIEFKPKQMHANKKKRRRHPKTEKHKKEPIESQEEKHAIMTTALDWLISHARIPNTSQLTALCMTIMVLTNIYIAFKMAGVDHQLTQMGRMRRTTIKDTTLPTSFEGDSLWQLLNKLDPDITEKKKTYASFQPSREQEDTRHKLDRQMLELERMIQRAGENMEQVSHVIQSQRKRILDNK